MKKTTAIILILCVIIAALTGMLIYEVNKQNWDIVIQPPVVDDSNNGHKEEENKNTQIEPDNAIIQERVEEKPEYDDLEVEAEYDVIVFGAEPEGVVGAVSSARNGLKTLLVEKRDGPGGLMTYGLLNTIDMNRDKNGTLLSQGIFEEFYEKIGNRDSFDVETAKKAFEELLEAEENITTMYNVKEMSVGASDTQVNYVLIDGKKYVAKAYMDCTQDADITVMAGGKYTVGWEDVNEKNRAMSATLVIKMEGVDWEEIRSTIIKENRLNTGCTNDSAWGFTHITQTYVPKQAHMRLKGLNIGRQDDGSVLINSLQILNANMLDESAKQAAYDKCVVEADYVAEFLIKNVPGFENAKLAAVAPELYVRETRHIVGEYRLTVKDELESTMFSNAIAMASYPIDLQTTSIYDWGYVIGSPDEYYIPFGVIVPQGFTNLLTIGRSGSYTSIAAGSARVIPTGMTLAESAGAACAISIERKANFQEILSNYSLTNDMLARMKAMGVYIDTESKPVVDTRGQYYKFIIEMCEKGILSLGYYNTFDPNETMSEKDFIVFVKTYLKRSFLREDLWSTDHINLLDASDKGITPNRMKEIIYDITTYNLKDEAKKKGMEDFLNILIPSSNEELNLVRIYEILMAYKDYLVREEI
ncbi:MAG: FAD-dependent oxidoreductase [Clostridia bacterium]|nr:FAD-dependent oxidoreductase [Clostridia bacterium]